MAVITAAQKAADALDGGGPRTLPIASGPEYAAVKAFVANVNPHGTPWFNEIRDANDFLVKVTMGNKGGDNGDLLTDWNTDDPGNDFGHYTGLRYV
jgi:hypothetical protein